ncbi:MAG: hypothetical protein EXR58_07410 [Chloroflexi bacterium]|nr:hypothetical protein [Chloroflexota bacterium]
MALEAAISRSAEPDRQIASAVSVGTAIAVATAVWIVLGTASLSADEASRAAGANSVGSALNAHQFLLGLWKGALGPSEGALRLLSLLWGVVAMVATWRLASSLGGRTTAVVAPWLLALTPLFALFVANASPHAQLLALGSAATASLVAGRGVASSILYGVLMAGAIWTHPGALLLFLSHGLYGGRAWRGEHRRFLIWLGIVTVIVAVSLKLIASFGSWPDLGSPYLPDGGRLSFWPVPLAVVALVAFGGLVFGAPGVEKIARALLILVPWLLFLIVPLFRPEAETWLAALALPTSALGLSLGIGVFARALAALLLGFGPFTSRGASMAQGIVTTLVILGFAGTGWADLNRMEAGRADYRGMTADVLALGRSGDLMILTAPGQRAVVDYYNRGRVPVAELPFGPAFLADSAEAMLAPLIATPRSLWAVSEGDPGDRWVVTNWLSSRLYPSAEYPHGRVNLTQYFSEPEMRTGSGAAVFGSLVEVPEAGVPSGVVSREFPLAVRLNLRAREPISARLLVLVELLSGGRVVAQHQGEPVGGTRPTNGWDVGEVVVDRLALPLPDSVRTGTYQLRVYVLDPAKSAKLRLAGGEEFLQLGDIRIGPSVRNPL